MKKLTLAALSLATVGLMAPGPLWATTCPVDLSALGPQIRTAAFASKLGTPISKLVADAGGVDQAIATARAKLTDIQSRRALLQVNSAPAVPMDDAIRILSAEIDALECLRNS